MARIFYGIFPLTGGGPLKGTDWACPSWGSWGICPLGPCPCSRVILILSREEVASPCSTRGTLAGTKTLVCLGKSVCTACTPSWHEGKRFRAACLRMNACIACTNPGLLVACLGRCACAAFTLSLWRLILPAWEWVPVLPVFLPGWEDYHCPPGTEHLHCLHSFPAGETNTFSLREPCLPWTEHLHCLHSFLAGRACLPGN